jgi:hypothetical protein
MKKMKITILLVLIAVFSMQANAQNPKKMEEMKAAKVAFITTKMQLTTEESKKFWPVYNKYEKESMEVKMEMRSVHKQLRAGYETMEDKQYDVLMNKLFALKTKENEIEKKYFNEFKKVVGIKKAALAFHAEREFYTKILHNLAEKRGKPDAPGIEE